MFCCIKALATLNSKAYIAGPGRRVMKLCIFTADIFFLVHVNEDNVTAEKKKTQKNMKLDCAKVWLILHRAVYA